MIETLQGFPANVVAVACHGHVSRDDYMTVLTPMVEAALAAHDKVRLYYEVAADFDGIEPSAAWQDFKIGMEHLTRWERMAVVSDVDWIRNMIHAFGFLMPGTIRTFGLDEAAAARTWIAA